MRSAVHLSPRLPEGVEVLERPADRSIVSLGEYWKAKRGERPLPLRRDIDPVELKHHLASIYMVDVLDGGRDFRYRLVGTAITEVNRRDVTGTTIRTEYGTVPAALDYADYVFGTVVREARPVFTKGNVFWRPGRGHRSFEAGYFPISVEGAAVDIVLAEVRFDKG